MSSVHSFLYTFALRLRKPSQKSLATLTDLISCLCPYESGQHCSFFGRETIAPLQANDREHDLQSRISQARCSMQRLDTISITRPIPRSCSFGSMALLKTFVRKPGNWVVDSRHDFHCSKDERFAEIEKELDKHVRYWLTQETRPRPKLPYPPHNPVGSRNVITPSPRAALDPPARESLPRPKCSVANQATPSRGAMDDPEAC